ncbi:MAG: MoaD/ThiS family protein [Candidatus Parvarchaeota archaeon]|jgi:sulfur carrier protein ThiS|nr:MoaD/ThiS family protein [Candidatus Parvarchaeota archaeon]MCL5420596.1 MoaD/ThiS family protein [Candidatus Parvarchaeota archaeon]
MEVKLKNVNFGEKAVSLSSGSVKELIEKLDLNDDSVILIGKNGRIYTKDEKVDEKDEINVIEVFSGG